MTSVKLISGNNLLKSDPNVKPLKLETWPGPATNCVNFPVAIYCEEIEGLYADTATIGFKLNWDRLLDERGLYYEGHHLKRRDGAIVHAQRPGQEPIVHRHKTALARFELSKPVRTLLAYGLLRPATTFFDYGCGLGTDVKALLTLGYQADGWDPVHRRETAQKGPLLSISDTC